MKKNWGDILITVGALLFTLGVIALVLLSPAKQIVQPTEPTEVDASDTLGSQFPR